MNMILKHVYWSLDIFFKREEIRTCSRYVNQKVDEGIQRLLLTSISLLISVFLFQFLHTCTVMMFSPKSGRGVTLDSSIFIYMFPAR